MSVYQGYPRIFNKLSCATLILLLVTGCGGGGGGGSGSKGAPNGSGGNAGNGGNGGNPGPVDNLAPTVSAITPGEDTKGVATNSKLTATFSEAMNPALLTAIDPTTNKPANFRLTDGTNSIAGTVSVDSTNNIAVFTPTAPLESGKRYTATIITGIKDLGENSLNTDFAWCFVVGGTADSTAPSVTSKIPGDALTGVPLNHKIVATFSEEMNSLTLTAANFTVTGPGVTPTPVSGTVTYRGRTAVFTPAQNFAANTTYTAKINPGAMDLAGIAAQAHTWSFITGANADGSAPAVLSTSPASPPAASEAGVATDKAITVNFSEPMDPATITTANFTVTMTGAGALPVIGTVALDPTNKIATFTRIKHLITPVVSHLTPVSYFDANTTYTVTLTTGVKDMAGNALANNLTWNFTTGATP